MIKGAAGSLAVLWVALAPWHLGLGPCAAVGRVGLWSVGVFALLAGVYLGLTARDCLPSRPGQTRDRARGDAWLMGVAISAVTALAVAATPIVERDRMEQSAWLGSGAGAAVPACGAGLAAFDPAWFVWWALVASPPALAALTALWLVSRAAGLTGLQQAAGAAAVRALLFPAVVVLVPLVGFAAGDVLTGVLLAPKGPMPPDARGTPPWEALPFAFFACAVAWTLLAIGDRRAAAASLWRPGVPVQLRPTLDLVARWGQIVWMLALPIVLPRAIAAIGPTATAWATMLTTVGLGLVTLRQARGEVLEASLGHDPDLLRRRQRSWQAVGLLVFAASLLLPVVVWRTETPLSDALDAVADLPKRLISTSLFHGASVYFLAAIFGAGWAMLRTVLAYNSVFGITCVTMAMVAFQPVHQVLFRVVRALLWPVSHALLPPAGPSLPQDAMATFQVAGSLGLLCCVATVSFLRPHSVVSMDAPVAIPTPQPETGAAQPGPPPPAAPAAEGPRTASGRLRRQLGL